MNDLTQAVRIEMSTKSDVDDIVWVEQPETVPAAPSAQPNSQSVAAAPLDEAMREGRIEFWYQPKIDLRLRRLVGVEAFARARDRAGNIMPTNELMAGASNASIVTLTEHALVSSLKTSVNLAEIGVDVRLAINVSVEALAALPIVDLVRKYRPEGGRSASLIFDVAEEQVLGNIEELVKHSAKLSESGFCVAVDDFGKSLLSRVIHEEAYDRVGKTFDAIRLLRNVHFAEMKLHRSLVKECSRSSDKLRVCKHIIDLAHDFGSTAVAVGIEKAVEMQALQKLDCDIGQGFLFGKPMSEEQFLMLLWDRGVKAKDRAA